MATKSLLAEFQTLCRTLLPTTKHEQLGKLFRKQTAFYDSAGSDFQQSAELEGIIKSHLANLGSSDNKGKEVFKSIWDLNQSLKGHRRVETQSVQNGTDEASSNKSDGETCQPSTSSQGTTDQDQGAVVANVAKTEGDALKAERNQRRIEKLERKLEKLHRVIQRLSERELTLDEMDDNCSTHMQEHKLRTKFVQGWEMLCKLKKTSSSTGRAKESRLVFRNSQYREINARITKLMNKPDYFPDYHDVLHLIGKVNKKYQLGIEEMEAGLLAREIFVDIGKELKKRRQQDLIQSFGYASFAAAANDPADESDELRMKLKQNQEESSKKLTEAINKFSREQQIREARGEDLEAASADEEEAPDDDEIPNTDGISGDEEPPAKKQKTDGKEGCDDGVNCNTDSELSDHQDVKKHDNGTSGTQDITPEDKVGNTVTEGSDIDEFIMNDDTAAILTSEDERAISAAAIGKAVSLDDSDLSSSHSVVALSSDDENFCEDRFSHSEEEGGEPDEAVVSHNVESGTLDVPPKLGSSCYDLGAPSSVTENCDTKPRTIVQVDFSCDDGRESMPTLDKYNGNSVVPERPNQLCAGDRSSKVGSDGIDPSLDPIDSLGDEGLVPVVQCHAYAYVGNRAASQSVGTMASTLPLSRTNGQRTSNGSNDCIEILDSSSPSPSVPDEDGVTTTEQSHPEQEEDVIFISDSE